MNWQQIKEEIRIPAAVFFVGISIVSFCIGILSSGASELFFAKDGCTY